MRTMLITGAGSGIGQELARRYARDFQLLLMDRQFRDAAPAGASTRECDVRDHQAVGEAIGDFCATHGPLDTAIHCAGVPPLTSDVATTDPDEFRRVVDINLNGTFTVVREAAPFLHRGSRLVLVASMAGLVTNYGYGAYAAAKHGVMGLAGCLRIEMKPKGITVQVVCPPSVQTPMIEQEYETISSLGKKLKDMAGEMTLADACDEIQQGIRRKQYLIIPGSQARLLAATQRFLPDWLTHGIVDTVVRFSS